MTLPDPDAPLRVSRTPAKVKQADIARAARVAKRLGDGWAVEIAPDATIRIVQHGGPVESRGDCSPNRPEQRGGRFPDGQTQTTLSSQREHTPRQDDLVCPVSGRAAHADQRRLWIAGIHGRI